MRRHLARLCAHDVLGFLFPLRPVRSLQRRVGVQGVHVEADPAAAVREERQGTLARLSRLPVHRAGATSGRRRAVQARHPARLDVGVGPHAAQHRSGESHAAAACVLLPGVGERARHGIVPQVQRADRSKAPSVAMGNSSALPDVQPSAVCRRTDVSRCCRCCHRMLSLSRLSALWVLVLRRLHGETERHPGGIRQEEQTRLDARVRLLPLLFGARVALPKPRRDA